MEKSNKEVIVFGATLMHPKTGKKPTLRVTSINIDSKNNTVSIVTEKDLKVENFGMSFEAASEIGFINIDALNGHIK